MQSAGLYSRCLGGFYAGRGLCDLFDLFLPLGFAPGALGLVIFGGRLKLVGQGLAHQLFALFFTELSKVGAF